MRMEKRAIDAAAGDAQGLFGTLSVNTADMSISHTPGSAGNIFSLDAGELSSSAENMQLSQGELIARMSQGEPEVVIEYAYDAAGLRTQKKVTENGVTTTTDYFLHGKLLTCTACTANPLV